MTLDRFVSALKKHLRATDDFVTVTGHDTQGYGFAAVEWEKLDKEIDAFCAEFQKKIR